MVDAGRSADGVDADGGIRDAGRAALFAFVAGAALWPPGAVYWEALAAIAGDAVALGAVAGLALVLGAMFARATGTAVRRVAAGGLVAYVAGMTAIELAMEPDGPAHFVLYGGILACLVAGAALGGVITTD